MIKTLKDAELLNPLDLTFISFNHKPRQYPNQSGVYFVKNDDDEILYIGRAIDLCARLSNHSRKTQFSENNYLISWVLVDRKVLNTIENFLISRFVPSINASPSGKDDDSWALESLIDDFGYANPTYLEAKEKQDRQYYLDAVQLFKDGVHPANSLLK
jgi:excinuclease UvrABC nuclease subunit